MTAVASTSSIMSNKEDVGLMELSMEQLSQLVQIAADTGAQAALAALGDGSSRTFQKLSASVTQIVTAAALQGVKDLDKEKADVRRKASEKVMDKRLYNTRLLLKHYRDLKIHFENAVFEFDTKQAAAESTPGEIWKILNNTATNEEVYIESIRKSAMRTMIIIQHIDRILGIYEAVCDKSGLESEKRQYRILTARYLDEHQSSIAEIADREHIHRRTAEKDLDAAIASVTALIFGVDAIKTL